MEKDFYHKILNQVYGLEISIPSEKERNTIHQIIYEELIFGVFKETSRQSYITIINGLKEKGAEGVIFGCTEIPLLVSSTDVSIATFNTTKIHSQKAVDFALAK